MGFRLAPLVFTVLLACLPQVGALTIYRMGGENLPEPDLDAPFNFERLDWSEVDESQHGKAELLEIRPDFMRPRQLDPGTNLAPRLRDQGGDVLYHLWIGGWVTAVDLDLFAMFDEDEDTIYLGDGRFVQVGDEPLNMIFDFGGLFFIDRLRVFPRQQFESERFMERLLIGITDGDPLKEATREYYAGGRHPVGFDIAHDIRENTRPVLELELPPVPIRRLLFQGFENTRGIWEVAEIQIFGAGSAISAGYVSNVIDLGKPASLGVLSWSGQQDPGAQIGLSMRSGGDGDPNNYWRFTFRGGERSRFGEDGDLLTLRDYQQLSPPEQAGITHDTENWGSWSTAYNFADSSGAMVASKTRQFVQFRADFASTREASGRLDFLQFAVSIPPVASQVLAEITPAQTAPGAVTSFTYRLRPRMQGDDLGFDRLVVDTPARPLSVDSLRLGRTDVPASDWAWRLLEEGGFEVEIPRIDPQQTEELIEVVFQAEVFNFGSVFSGRVFDSTQPHEVPQGVTPGDADELVDSNTLSVALSNVGQKTIQVLRLSPRAFTPNGDGTNDVVRIEVDLLNLVGPVPVRVMLYDLAGRRLGAVGRDEASGGRFSTTWDGRDAQGALLPPGLYILRLEVEADEEKASKEGVVSLVY